MQLHPPLRHRRAWLTAALCSVGACCLLLLALLLHQPDQALFAVDTQEWARTAPPMEAVAGRRVFLNLSPNQEEHCRAVAGRVQTGCIDVVYGVDMAYLPPLLASISSVLHSTHRVVRVTVLTLPHLIDTVAYALGGVERFKQTPIQVLGYNPERLRPLIKIWEGRPDLESPVNYARFYLPVLLPNLTHVIYLDPDTVVLQDIGELMDLLVSRQNQRAHVLATPFSVFLHPRAKLSFLFNCDQPEIAANVDCSAESVYFNAGVMAINLNNWRSHNVTQQLEGWMALNANKRLWKWGSQAPLVLVLHAHWRHLPHEFNFRRGETSEFRTDPGMQSLIKILHFTGVHKPWLSNSPQLWPFWCPHFPYRHRLWFCRLRTSDPEVSRISSSTYASRETVQRALPRSPMDYRHFVEILRNDVLALVVPPVPRGT